MQQLPSKGITITGGEHSPYLHRTLKKQIVQNKEQNYGFQDDKKSRTVRTTTG